MIDYYLIFNIITILYIWFDTDAIVEYAKLFRLRFFKYKEYENRHEVYKDCEYAIFIAAKYNNFFTKLAACPICLSVWFNFLFISVILRDFKLLGIHIVLTWLGYNIIRWIIKECNE